VHFLNYPLDSIGGSLSLSLFFQGDGPKLVRELFRVAEEHSPSIVFIDEIDAIGTKRWAVLSRS
jgi:ATP-dependent 26S proteasome regulatory subunit